MLTIWPTHKIKQSHKTHDKNYRINLSNIICVLSSRFDKCAKSGLTKCTVLFHKIGVAESAMAVL